MKTVTYRTRLQRDCECEVAVVLAVATSIAASGFINATLTASNCVWDACYGTIHQYIFEYDEAQMIDPSYSLLSADISGFICDKTLIDYIDYKTGT